MPYYAAREATHARGVKYVCGCVVSSNDDATPILVFPETCFMHKKPILHFYVTKPTPHERTPKCG